MEPSAVPVTFGVTDGLWTELLGATLDEGTPLITRVTIGEVPAARGTTSPASNPLMGAQQGRTR